jgi:MOSC domain-containing protein YiiM
MISGRDVLWHSRCRSYSQKEEEVEVMANTVGRVLSVNVGQAREFEYNRRPAKSAIWKSPVAGRIAARGVNLEGDEQADRKAHGGPDKAIYAYAIEDARWWEQELGRSLQYGEFGENLTTQGIAVNDAIVGERWEIGTTVLEVSEPRVPCWRLGVRMSDERFPRRFTLALRPGTYLRIIVEGYLGAGDEIRVIERPDHDVTIRDVFRIYTHDRNEIARLIAIPGISESWRKWAESWLQKAKGRRTDAAAPTCC